MPLSSSTFFCSHIINAGTLPFFISVGISFDGVRISNVPNVTLIPPTTKNTTTPKENSKVVTNLRKVDIEQKPKLNVVAAPIDL